MPFLEKGSWMKSRGMSFNKYIKRKKLIYITCLSFPNYHWNRYYIVIHDGKKYVQKSIFN